MDRATALAALDDAASPYTPDVELETIRAALRALLPDSPDRSGLDWYWDSATTGSEMGRISNMSAALRRIRLILDGWRQTGEPCGLLRRSGKSTEGRE